MALLQAEPLPAACRLGGLWPRSPVLLRSNASTLVLNSSSLHTWGEVIRIRVTGVNCPPTCCQGPETNQKP